MKGPWSLCMHESCFRFLVNMHVPMVWHVSFLACTAYYCVSDSYKLQSFFSAGCRLYICNHVNQEYWSYLIKLEIISFKPVHMLSLYSEHI